jgi:putative restriction endonuclease
MAKAKQKIPFVAQDKQAYILTWNPTKWPWDEDAYDGEVDETTAGKLFLTQWSCGNRKSIAPGDRLFLMRQESDRGLIGSGIAVSNSFSDAHWDGSPEKMALYVKYQSDTLLATDDRLSVEQLLEADLGVSWNYLFASGVQVPGESIERLERMWRQHLVRIGRSLDDDLFSNDGEQGEEPKDEDKDEIERVLRQIVARRGQPVFRERLLKAYGNRCAITGCDAKAALEAAHIKPYCGPSSNGVSNGLLLRSDIHTLFDLGLIAVSPTKLTVALAQELVGTEYEKLNGIRVRLPKIEKHRPDKKALDRRWKQFTGRIA